MLLVPYRFIGENGCWRPSAAAGLAHKGGQVAAPAAAGRSSPESRGLPGERDACPRAVHRKRHLPTAQPLAARLCSEPLPAPLEASQVIDDPSVCLLEGRWQGRDGARASRLRPQPRLSSNKSVWGFELLRAVPGWCVWVREQSPPPLASAPPAPLGLSRLWEHADPKHCGKTCVFRKHSREREGGKTENPPVCRELQRFSP